MAIATLRQTVTASDDDCSSLTCVVSPTQVGNELVAFVATNETNDSNFASGITDSAGNVWSRITTIQTAAPTGFTHQGTDDYRNVTTGQGSWTIAAGTTGNLRLVDVRIGSQSINVTSLSGGGVTTWQRAGTPLQANGNTVELWWGVITSAGTTLTINYSSAIGSTNVRNHRVDFSAANPNGTIICTAAGGLDNTSSTTVTFPALNTGGSAAQLYFGVGWVGGTASSGSTPGYTYTIDPNGNPYCYKINAGPNTTEQPTCTETVGTSDMVAALFQQIQAFNTGEVSLEVWHAPNAQSINKLTATWTNSESSSSIIFSEMTGVVGYDTSATFTSVTTNMTESLTPTKYGDVFLFCGATGNSSLPMTHSDTTTTPLAAAGYQYTAGTATKASNMLLTGSLVSGSGLTSPQASFSTTANTHMAGICVAFATQNATSYVGSGPAGLTGSWQMLWNGLSLGAGTSYGISALDGLREVPSMRSTDDPRSLQDGTFLAPDYMNGRTIGATIIITGTSDADLAYKVQSFENAFVPTSGSTLELPLYWQLPNGLQRRVFGRLRRRSALVDFNYQFHAAKCAVEFYCSDPLTYDAFDTVATLSPATSFPGRTYNRVFPFSYGAGTNPSTFNAINTGNVNTYPVVTFYGPSQNPYIINNTTGAYMWFNVTLNQGDIFQIDTRQQTALLNGSSVRGNLIQGSTWMVLQPGINNFQFTPGSGSGQCQVTFRSAWL